MVAHMCLDVTLHIHSLSCLVSYAQGSRASSGTAHINTDNTRAVQNVSGHFEYLENWLRGPDVTWQPVRGDLTVHL